MFLHFNPLDCHLKDLLILAKRSRRQRCPYCRCDGFDGNRLTFTARGNGNRRICNRCRTRIPEDDLEHLTRHRS